MAKDNLTGEALKSQYYKPADPAQPNQDRFDYNAFLSKVGEMSQKTRQVFDPGLPSLKDYKQAWKMQGKPSGGAYPMLQQAYQEYGTQKEVKQQQADKAAEALQLRGQGFADYMRNIFAVQQQTRTDVEKGKEAYGEASAQAEQYVKESVARKEQILSTVSDLADEMLQTHDFEKAHAMQASVQAALGQYSQREREIAREFGRDSAEFEALQVEKATNMGQMQSSIHASYREVEDQLRSTILNTTAEAALKSDMYINFQEQMHVETLKAMAQMDAQYSLQLGNFEIGLEQMRMAGLDEMANWFTSTPAYAMDTQSIMSLLELEGPAFGPPAQPVDQYTPGQAQARAGGNIAVKE
jgi:hypothetical protein